MNIRTLGIIIRREYLEKVKKKSFLFTTFLVPILAGGGMIALMAIMMNTKDEHKTVAVSDQSGIVLPFLENNEAIEYLDVTDENLAQVKASLESRGFNAVLGISAIDTVRKTVNADITSLNPLGMELTQNINHKINDAVEAYRIASYGIDDLDRIMKDVKADVKLNAYTIDDEGKETVSETGVYAMFSMILGIIIFIFIMAFGSSVMSAVIEEKSSRVIEVLISSVKSTELMFGKIIGVALVAVTQFVLWVVLTGVIVSVAGSAMGDKLASLTSDPVEMAQTMGVDQAAIDAAVPVTAEYSGLQTAVSTIKGMPLGLITVSFLIFFIFGYILYASLFAAIGSAVDNVGDSSQLQTPVTIPLMVAYIIAIYAFKAPDSQIAFWGSIIPFTSPIVMIARLPFGVEFWELLLSLGLLVITSFAFAWASAKIYKVGILMFGKKSTWKDLLKWLKQN